MKNQPAVTLAAAALLALSIFTGCSSRAETTAPKESDLGTVAVSTVTVVGTGKLTLMPDMATVSLGVCNSATTASEAVAQNAKAMDSITAALKAAGIKDEDLQTSNYSLYPDYVYDKHDGQDVQRNYNVSNTLTLKVRELEKLGQITDAAVAAGANESYGVSFGMQEPDASRAELAMLAVKDARAQAEEYATALGMKLGAAISVTSGSSADDEIIYEQRSSINSEADASVKTAFQPGTLEQFCLVTIRFRLE